MKPSPPKTIMTLDFFNVVILIFLIKKDLIFNEFFVLSKTKLRFIHLVVPSARLELALQKGTDFKSVVSTNFTTRAHRFFICLTVFIYNSTSFC